MQGFNRLSIPETRLNAPITPEPLEQNLVTPAAPGQPPDVRRFRIRRRRLPSLDDSAPIASISTLPFLEGTLDDEDIVPSIEVTDHQFAVSVPRDIAEAPLDKTNATAAALAAAIAPQHAQNRYPRTPSPQIMPPAIDRDGTKWRNPNSFALGLTIPRPDSACSEMSESSVGSSSYFSDIGGQLSPERPASSVSFPSQMDLDDNKHQPRLLGSALPDSLSAPRNRTRAYNASADLWTKDMDDHLWRTYVDYANDPTVTPFKTVPNGFPPAGITTRVASEAKRTWKQLQARKAVAAGTAASSPTLSAAASASFQSLDAAMATINDSEPTLSSFTSATTHDSTLRPGHMLRYSSRWPSRARTRHRLRHLCKVHGNVPTYYKRVLYSRSPSPQDEMTDVNETIRPGMAMNISNEATVTTSAAPSRRVARGASMPARSRGFGASHPYQTRDVALSLAQSTSESMDPNGPIARLTAGRPVDETRGSPAPRSSAIRRSGDFYFPSDRDATIRPNARHNVRHKSHSLQLATGVTHRLHHPWASHSGVLASPFEEEPSGSRARHTWQPPRQTASTLVPSSLADSTGVSPVGATAQLSTLSPEIQHPRPRPTLSGSMKRRQPHDASEGQEDDELVAWRQLLHANQANHSASNHRVRMRAVSIGSHSRPLGDLFSTQSSLNNNSVNCNNNLPRINFARSGITAANFESQPSLGNLRPLGNSFHTEPSLLSSSSHVRSTGESVNRLGTPFGGDSQGTSNTFPRLTGNATTGLSSMFNFTVPPPSSRIDVSTNPFGGSVGNLQDPFGPALGPSQARASEEH